MKHINSKASLFWSAGLAAVALVWAITGLSQPLWLDELHTNWVIADNWSELAGRAAQGNQTPVYFFGLKLWTAIFGNQAEWLIRLPSALAWSAAIASLTWMLLRLDSLSSRCQPSKLSIVGRIAIVIWCSCVLVDAWQYFYAVEARVYSVVQLLNLWSWYLVTKLVDRRPELESETRSGSETRSETGSVWLWLAWASLAIAMLHLHITAGLGVSFQCLILVVITAWSKRDRAYCLTSQILVAANVGWLIYDSQSVWQRRQQWASFAGDGTLSALVGVLPFAPLLLPVIVGWLSPAIARWIRSSNLQPNSLTHPVTFENLTTRQSPTCQLRWILVCLWGIAALGPVLLAWLLTRYDIAPMFHYRFVIVSALPLYLFAGSWWLCQSNLVVRWVMLVTVFGWMNLSHGPLAQQQQGRWQNERQEDWRSASAFVSQQHQHWSQSQSLWCYAGLIEGLGLQLPISPEMDEYLSYPLRGSYRIAADPAIVTPHGLVADRKAWLKQIRQTTDKGSTEWTSAIQVWIIYRGSPERLAADLQSAGMHHYGQLVPIHRFGRVSVVCLQIE